MRVWKLQDFVAHSGRVHCARLGEKSGQVLATGGDDKRVNIWKVGKPHAMMSLAGHSSAVECLVFDKQEEVLVVGCAGGSMQIWNLEYRKMAATLTGHRTACNSVEFHPYGEFFASGSADTNLKIWDLRRKTCIQTYKGHSGSITSIRFSPHGRWVATGGQDNQVKIWDLTAGKLMRDLDTHKGPITSLAFHPKEYLLATGSADRTMKLWSLENFKNVGSTDISSSSVQAVKFYVEEQAVLAASHDSLKLFSTDSLSTPLDTIDVDWRGLQDMRLCLPEEKLIGVSTEGSQLGIWVADLQRREAGAVRPIGGSYARPNARSSATAGANSNHNSLGKQQAPRRYDDTADENEAPRLEISEQPPQRPPKSPAILPRQGTDNAAVANVGGLAARQRSRSNNGTNFYEHRSSSSPKATSDHNSAFAFGDIGQGPLSGYADVRSGLEERSPKNRVTRPVPQPPALDTSSDQAPTSYVPRSGLEERSPKSQVSRPAPQAFAVEANGDQASGSYAPSRSGLEERGLKSPVSRQAPQPFAEEACADEVQQLSLQHPQMMGVLQRRLTQVRRAKELWSKGNLSTLSTGLQFPQDHAVVCDFARAIMKEKLVGALNLGACQTLLPIMRDLMCSKYDDFAVTGHQFTELLLHHFGDIISETRLNCARIPETQLDPPREDRLQKCNACHQQFCEIQKSLLDGRLASRFVTFREALQKFLKK